MSVRFKVSPQQRAILASTTRGNMFLGGIGSGKSLVLCWVAILNALRGRRFCIVSFSYTTLRDVILHTLQQELPKFGLKPGIDYAVNRTTFTINIRGTEILLRSPGDKPDRLRGPNLAAFGIDEGREFPDRSVYDVMLGRIRAVEDAQWYITSTTKGRNWMWEIVEAEDLDKEVQKNRHAANERLTVTTQTTKDAVEYGFLPQTYYDDLVSQYSSKYAAQELRAEVVDFSGDIINSSWFRKVDYVKPSAGCRFWDVAVSIRTNADYSAGALCNYSGDAFCLTDMKHGRWPYPDLKKLIITTAEKDGKGIMIGLEEAGQQKGFIDDLRRAKALRGYTIKAVKPRGDKLARALPWISSAELGNMKVCQAPWNKEFFDECDSFQGDGKSPHDDQIDAVSGAHAVLTHKHIVQFVKQAY